MIFTDDNRQYTSIVQSWIREFKNNKIVPAGVKIIFDGYGYNETTNNEDDLNFESFAVFVHLNSLTEEFPPHEETPWALIHRPKEEVCIYCWYDIKNDSVSVIPFEDNNSTELKSSVVYNLISNIQKRDKK